MTRRTRLPVYLPAPFASYRCNLAGCCCGGWGITWLPEDLARLARRLPNAELTALTRDHLELELEEGTNQVLAARLDAYGPGGRCPLLSADGACTLQQRYGVGTLPGICIDFPVVPYRFDGRIELSYRFTCPGVLACVFADQGPVDWLELAQPDEMFTARLRRVGPPPELTIAGEPVPEPALRALRDAVLAPLNDRSRPTLELLAELEWGLSRLQSVGALADFAPLVPPQPLPFVRYLLHCVRTHSAAFLVDNLARYRRFLVAGELPEALDAVGLAATLEHWEEPLVRWVEPAEPALRPYLQRYLALRYSSCFVHVQGELRYSFGEVTHELALALRYLASLAELLGRAPDPSLLAVSLGAAAHLFHTHGFPFQARVWFNPDDFASEVPPPPQVPDWLQAEYVQQSHGPAGESE